MLNILRRFIEGEWTGNWNLHLHSMKQMLAYLAASGHSLYAKSAYIYLLQTPQEQHSKVLSGISVGYSCMFYVGVTALDRVVTRRCHWAMCQVCWNTYPWHGYGWLTTQPVASVTTSLCWYELSYAKSYRQRECTMQHAESSQSILRRDDDKRSVLNFLI